LWTTIAKGKIWKGEIENRKMEVYIGCYTIVPFLNKEAALQYIVICSDINERKVAAKISLTLPIIFHN
jgi:hypothetical protein